ncbi:isocyanide synthase family protein [Kribbella sp. NBC_01505]|uniref:L-tyrosine/L-tryptophan isonitrile synthase family protein n=1 Tax=Kribbella sp. NBC_01505 TaxID=2903580 RepID=UPI00386AA86B
MTTVLTRLPAPIGAAPSLARTPLHELDLPPQRRLALDHATLRRLTTTLTGSATEAAVRLAARTPADPVDALIHLLTRNRFLKGSRSNAPVESARHLIRRFVQQGEPVPVLLRGFPFKHHDNRLKAEGPAPDLAETAAFTRLTELASAYRHGYPPGLHITVLTDGGYYRPRPTADLTTYQRQLEAPQDVVLVAQADALQAAAPDAWAERGALLAGLLPDLTALAGTHDPIETTSRFRRSGLVPADGVPAFDALFRSLTYSVPVPGIPDAQWSATVLGEVHRTDAPGSLGEARRAVLRQARQDALHYTAVATADHRLGLFAALPQLRLASGAPRPGTFGFSYLGGSLLPWHGSGYVDERLRVGVDFAVTLRAAGYVAVGPAAQPYLYAAPAISERLADPAARLELRLKSR